MSDAAVHRTGGCASRSRRSKPGDGVVFDAASWSSPQEAEEGGRIYAVSQQRDGTLILRFGIVRSTSRRVRSGDLVWRTHDPDLDKAVRPYLEAATPVAKQPVDVRVVAREGAPLRRGGVSANRGGRRLCGPLGSASNRALTKEFLREQFRGWATRLTPSPSSSSTSRRAVRARLGAEPDSPRSSGAIAGSAERRPRPRRACVLPESRLEAALARGMRTRRGIGASRNCICSCALPNNSKLPSKRGRRALRLDYLDLYGLKPSVERLKASGITARVASPRVLKPGEERIVGFSAAAGVPAAGSSVGLVDALRERSAFAAHGRFQP